MMTDRQYDFHVVPRYDTVWMFNGVEWTDSAWPSPPDMLAPQADEPTLIALRDHGRRYL